MAFESTAINDLISGQQRQPLRREHQDDWLFGTPDDMFAERGDPTQIDPSQEDTSTTPFDKATPLPAATAAASPYPRVRMLDYPQRSQSPTTHVRLSRWSSVGKKIALPIGLFSIVIVLLGVYFAKTDEATSAPAMKVAAASSTTDVTVAAAASTDDVKVEAHAVEIEAPAPEPIAAAPAPAPVAAAEPAAPTVAAAPTSAPAPAPAAAAAPAQADVLIEPGSPASRFLPSAAEPTLPTVPTVAPKAAPAPQTIPDLPAPTAKPAPVERPVVAKSAARAVPKRMAKAKPRPQKKVAVAAKAAPAKVSGKGVLSLSSSPSMHVWVDGRNSGAQTPVRIILLAGKHKVTLLDKSSGKAKSFEVVIKPDQTTKIAKSY